MYAVDVLVLLLDYFFKKVYICTIYSLAAFPINDTFWELFGSAQTLIRATKASTVTFTESLFSFVITLVTRSVIERNRIHFTCFNNITQEVSLRKQENLWQHKYKVEVIDTYVFRVFQDFCYP